MSLRRRVDEECMTTISTAAFEQLAPCMSSSRCPLAHVERKTYRIAADCPACALDHMDAEAADAAAKLSVMGGLSGDAPARGAEVRRRLAVTEGELQDVAQSVVRARTALDLSTS